MWALTHIGVMLIRFIGKLLSILSTVMVLILLPIIFFGILFHRRTITVTSKYFWLTFVIEAFHLFLLLKIIVCWPIVFIPIMLAVHVFTNDAVRQMIDDFIDYKKDWDEIGTDD